MGSLGEKAKSLYCSNIAHTMFEEGITHNGKIVQNGREVYKWAVTTVPKGMKKVMEHASMPLHAVDWFIPHSANLKMIESICEKSGFPIEKTLYSLVEYGNTSAASIPLSFVIGVKEKKLKTGDTLLLYGFGGGLTHAGLLIKWSVPELDIEK